MMRWPGLFRSIPVDPGTPAGFTGFVPIGRMKIQALNEFDTKGFVMENREVSSVIRSFTMVPW
jgi:hypothetical protein